MEFPKCGTPILIEEYWTKKAEKVLLGKIIVKVEYLSKETVDDWGWYKRPIMFTLNDGTTVIAQMDDEGNDGGVLVSTNPSDHQDDLVMPVL